MDLKTYNKKRDFTLTREPQGSARKTGKELVFVVQKHAATRLHYDLRLEMDGVLKSWAVPKGPSMNPDDKRLAVLVEDHPFDYKDFEGNIPKGNYGAGNVIIWDNGTYSTKEGENNEKKLVSAFEKGRLSFVLNGKKLKGEFSLVKLKNAEDNTWLLMKKNDKYASKADVLKKNKSVVSSKTIESLERANAKIKSPMKKKRRIE
jgi:bifunctional non-homologous end joining protein LigD